MTYTGMHDDDTAGADATLTTSRAHAACTCGTPMCMQDVSQHRAHCRWHGPFKRQLHQLCSSATLQRISQHGGLPAAGH